MTIRHTRTAYLIPLEFIKFVGFTVSGSGKSFEPFGPVILVVQ